MAIQHPVDTKRHEVTRLTFEVAGDPRLAAEVAAEMVPAIRGRGLEVRAARAGEQDVLGGL